MVQICFIEIKKSMEIYWFWVFSIRSYISTISSLEGKLTLLSHLEINAFTKWIEEDSTGGGRRRREEDSEQ